ncbi:mycothiol system anti-sigma-R factor [Micropruina sonneratiae]|uniref:mycothiol system anti-sigma-R factor n=1 Tax=Micropruina sonneratiae TaxID=2986940 RepID=UPI002226DA82|nr:mycothiol system anti-sigma-R factor [Micropruina sp. KQZ13P-5]MCW3157512.1 mycothiol system anti-sigma-R factor [Micropruina sp. KQZ13P-5]
MSGPDCRTALAKLYQFLDHELADADADTIRAHLDACEPCLEEFGVEEHIRALVKRCCGAPRAPETLRVRITQVTTTTVIVRKAD